MNLDVRPVDDDGMADEQARRRLRARTAAGFLALSAGLGFASLPIHGYVRPGTSTVVFTVVICIAAAFSVVAVVLRSAPASAALCLVLLADGLIVTAGACLSDRGDARLVTALLAAPTMYVALYLPRWALFVQGGVSAAGTIGLMTLAGERPAVVAIHSTVVLASIISPAIALFALRGQLAAALRRERLYASTDPLTGLYNRRALAQLIPEAVERAVSRSFPVGVVVADIDHFKTINDRLGHLGGDGVLQRVAAAVRRSVREDDAVIRLGGEEFAVLTAVPADLLTGMAERLRVCVATDLVDLGVTMSVGVAWSEPVSLQGDLLDAVWAVFDRADEAMYRAKRAGRNRVGMPLGLAPLTSGVPASGAAGAQVAPVAPVAPAASVAPVARSRR